MSVPRAGELAADVRGALALADRAAHGVDLADEVERVARLDDPLELHVVDAREERELAAVLLLGEDRDRSALRHRLDHQHARHHGPLGEVARPPPLLAA